MKNTIMLDHENGRIVMDRTFANLAVNVRTEEYKILQEVRLAYPTYIVVRRTIKKNPNRECYRGLTYDYMRDYISRYEPEESRESVRAELEDMIQISRCHSRCKRYPVIKQWFLEKYPDVKTLGWKHLRKKKQRTSQRFLLLQPIPRRTRSRANLPDSIFLIKYYIIFIES